jgi:copper oxidase (laccase) domain-containing protein
MVDDPIIEEVRKIRDEYAKRFNYDLEAIAADQWKKIGLISIAKTGHSSITSTR